MLQKKLTIIGWERYKMIFNCGVTVYNPNNIVVEHIKQYASVFNKVYVYDNTVQENINVINEKIKCIKNIVYISSGDNIGLPGAFNKILDVIDDETDFLCTIDQDSEFTNDNIYRLMSYIQTTDCSNIGIIAPKVL